MKKMKSRYLSVVSLAVLSAALGGVAHAHPNDNQSFGDVGEGAAITNAVAVNVPPNATVVWYPLRSITGRIMMSCLLNLAGTSPRDRVIPAGSTLLLGAETGHNSIESIHRISNSRDIAELICVVDPDSYKEFFPKLGDARRLLAQNGWTLTFAPPQVVQVTPPAAPSAPSGGADPRVESEHTGASARTVGASCPGAPAPAVRLVGVQ